MPLPPVPKRRDSTPWWRLPIVWMVIGGPALVVVASFVTLGLALSHPDPVLSAPPALSASELPAVQGRNHAATPRPRSEACAMKHLARRAATIAWPAFLGAGALEMAVFAFVDPATLSLPGGAALDLSATTVYSLAFFVFWAVATAACALTWLLAQGAEEVNPNPVAGG